MGLKISFLSFSGPVRKTKTGDSLSIPRVAEQQQPRPSVPNTNGKIDGSMHPNRFEQRDSQKIIY